MNVRSRWLARVAGPLAVALCCLGGRARVAAAQASDTAARPAGAAPQAPQAPQFDRRTAMVPMRDGVRLNTHVYVPRGATGPLPILFRRTPYGIAGAAGAFAAHYKELAADGYIFVFQDIRGRYASEGTFVMQRPARTAPRAAPIGRAPHAEDAVDEGTDAYDTIDWLLKNVPGHNGRVGMLGVSYDGWTTAMALLEPHPALRAASPQASPADMWMGDDFHHNGAFRLSYGFEYAAMMETSKENEQFRFDVYDTYDWYLRLGPLSAVNARVLKGKIPTWNDFVAHPDYDAFWKRQTMLPAIERLARVTVPTLNVAGWWDQEDFYGPFAIYQALERRDAAGRNALVVGPWRHGGWNAPDGRTLGNIDFGGATSRYFRERVQAPFFARHLKDRAGPPTPEAHVFESGSNRWRSFAKWPPAEGVTRRPLYFRAGGELSFEPPPAGGRDTADAFVSDPAHPVPYRARPIQPTYDPRGSGWGAWLTEDQRFVAGRPDVLVWQTAPLAEEVTIAGDVVATLFASTTGTDADWVVKLIDVYPEEASAADTVAGGEPRPAKMNGYQLMVSGEVFRGRYRESFERPRALAPGAALEYRVDLHGQSYRFGRGHRIMVQVQSTWFPVIDRNPQTFVPNIFAARAEDFRARTHRVFRAPARASRVTLPVLTRPAADPGR